MRRPGIAAVAGALLFDWRRQFELSLDPETAQAMHDQTLADDYFKTAEFCSSAARSSAPMHNFKDINWDELQAVVAQRKRERTLAAG